MGVSETIVAAMIGALATVTTALFQLFGLFRAPRSNKPDSKPRRGSTPRSVLAVLALMVASAGGGFLYSELLKQRNFEDLRAMRMEFKELKELTAAAARNSESAQPSARPAVSDPAPPQAAVIPATFESVDSTVESVVYVPACRVQHVGTTCQEADAQRIALCGTIPNYARIQAIDLFVQPNAVQDSWDEHRAAIEQDLGGARFTGKSFEYAQSGDLKAVCVNFMHWSSEQPHIARMVVQFGFGESPMIMPAEDPATDTLESLDSLESTAVDAPAVVAADAPTVLTQTTSFAAPVSAR